MTWRIQIGTESPVCGNDDDTLHAMISEAMHGARKPGNIAIIFSPDTPKKEHVKPVPVI